MGAAVSGVHRIDVDWQEPAEAFPNRPPSQQVRERFAHLWEIDEPLPTPAPKVVIDKIVALTGLLIAAPVLVGLFLANWIEGRIFPTHRGPLFFSYVAASHGQKFRKHKIRQVKLSEIDTELAARGDWRAFAREWSPQSLTYVGRVVKALYLDELPQLWDILRGKMSLVGPRPLAWHHYERDLEQGNVSRKLVQGGLLGPGQALKGTTQRGDPSGDLEYADIVRRGSAWALLVTDVTLVLRGIAVIFRARGA